MTLSLSLSSLKLVFLFSGIASAVSLPSSLSRSARSPVAVLQSQSTNRLINDPACPEIRSLCNKLPSADDLTVLECVQSLQVRTNRTIKHIVLSIHLYLITRYQLSLARAARSNRRPHLRVPRSYLATRHRPARR